MDQATSGWVFADSWVFAAIATNGRRCSLADVVGAADMINHAILLDDEVETALGKLTGAGFIRVFDDWTFEVTDEGATLWSGGGRSLPAHLDSVATQLSAVVPGGTRVNLPRGALDSAIKDYLRNARG
jgi:hypothetical protein